MKRRSSQFLEVPEQFSEYARSRVVVWPLPYERTTTWGKGTSRGPRAILDASAYVEYYDDELDWEPFHVGIHTLPETDVSDATEQAGLDQLYENAGRYFSDGKFILALGGEHSLSTPIIRAAKDKYPDLSVLQIDAHADLRDTYEGTPHSHACVMRRVVEICPAVQVGIRSISREERDAVSGLPSEIFYARDIVGNTDWIERAVGALTDCVYLTIDVDGFDPAIMPATGTPEPGGLAWYEVLTLIRHLAQTRKIVGADIVELMPLEGQHASDFLCAKLAYKIVSYVFGGGESKVQGPESEVGRR